jgi:fluoroquinolone resistance protein
VKSVERLPLTNEELKDLSDIGKFNTTKGKQGWILKGRAVEEMGLSGMELSGATMEDVGLAAVDLSGAQIRSSRFTRVDFGGTDLSGTEIEDAHFGDCAFVGVRAEGTVFRRCVFSGCRGERMSTARAVFENCTFDTFSGKLIEYDEATLKRTGFKNSSLAHSTFYGTALEGVDFINCKLEMVSFSEILGKNLRFAGGSISETGFDNATYEGIAFEQCMITDTTLKAMKISELRVARCNSMDMLRFVRCNMKGVTVSECLESGELTFRESQVTDLRLKKNTLDSLNVEETEVAGESILDDLGVKYCSLSGSEFDGALIRRMTVGELLLLENASFRNVRLKGVGYGKGIEIRAGGVKYVDSDEFPAR